MGSGLADHAVAVAVGVPGVLGVAALVVGAVAGGDRLVAVVEPRVVASPTTGASPTTAAASASTGAGGRRG